MKNFLIVLSILVIISCKHQKIEETFESDFSIVFASCNDQDREQPLWKPIYENKASVFIWGGDNIYADTNDMEKMESDYNKVHANSDYAQLLKQTTVIGTWDDHDYGKNDAGIEWEKKKEAQQLFLDFLKFSKEDPLRSQEGIYYSRRYDTKMGSIKIVLLDTRYFRDSLKKSTIEGKRYEPWGENEGGSILGEAQWNWLKKELEDSSSDFTIIVSSIQVLADEHGWEKWGNHPSEVKRMLEAIKNAKAKNIMILSGDRHIAEFSVSDVEGLPYSLVDFTTSGLTHTYPESPDTPNRFRKGKLVKDLNFGVLKFDFQSKKVRMEIRGRENKVLEVWNQQY
jgi:alkaline phosphatase D